MADTGKRRLSDASKDAGPASPKRTKTNDGSTAATTPSKRRVILDTDMGSDVDDALCLALALACTEEVELVAVTTVAKHPQLRAAIAQKLLEIAGVSGVGVYAGRGERLREGAKNEFVWFDIEGEGILSEEDVSGWKRITSGTGSASGLAGRDGGIAREDATPTTTTTSTTDAEAPTSTEESSAQCAELLSSISDESAEDAIIRIAHEQPGIELVCVGPLSNVAAALAKDATLPECVSQITLMGGHFGVVGYGGKEFPHGVDYNTCSDAEASVAVFTSGIPMRLVTADVTLQTFLDTPGLDAIAATDTPLNNTIARAVRIWTPVQTNLFASFGADMSVADNVAFLHDPLAFTACFDESYCTFEDMHVKAYINEGGVFRTEKVGEGEGVSMRVAVSVNADAFRSFFVDRLVRARL